MNLIVDQGNTATKLALFDSEKKCVQKASFPKRQTNRVNSWVLQNAQYADSVLVSSVTNDVLTFPQRNQILLTHQTPIPIKNEYATPETLGRDRLANAIGIWAKNPEGNSLCVDLGTCIKYDLVINGAYKGGNISPGLQMRYTALSHFTDKLPLLEPQEFDYGYGTSTKTSMQNGVQQAIFHEINGFINRYEEEFGQLTIFMTGGDLKYFDKGFKNSIFADSDLTVYGLNEILRYNVER